MAQLTDEQIERKIARLGPSREKADLLLELGHRTFYSSIDRAFTLFEQALALATDLKYPAGSALAHQHLASWYSRSDRWQDSLPHAEKALALYRDLRDRRGEATALRLVGEAMITSGDYPKAEEILLQALELQRAEYDTDAIGHTLGSLGFLYNKSRKPEQARRAFEDAREMFTASGNQLRLASVSNNLAVIESDAGNYAKALAILESLVPIREQLGDISGLVETYGNIGNQYAMFADYPTALDYMLKGLHLA